MAYGFGARFPLSLLFGIGGEDVRDRNFRWIT
jgi:hypothetical protein